MLGARLIATIIAIGLMMPVALAGTGTISIYGTNASNAQSNLTVTGTDNVVNVTGWNVGSGIKRFYVNVTNASDTLTVNVYNVTANQVVELKINGVAINGYLSNSNGLVTFTRTQSTGNVTWDIRPATISGGYNWTWGYFQNLMVTQLTTIYNVTVYNATAINGDGSRITNLNLSNASSGTIPTARYGTGVYVANISDYESNLTGRGYLTSSYNSTYDLKLTNVTSGGNITITWTGCPSACVANISSIGGGSGTGSFLNISVHGQTALTDYAVLVNGSGIGMTQSGNNITVASTETTSIYHFTGDGSTKNFTLTNAFAANSTHVYINGLKQYNNGTVYTENLTIRSVNLTTAPANNDAIEIEAKDA